MRSCSYAERGRSESESSSVSVEIDCCCFLERFLERVLAAFLPMVTVDVEALSKPRTVFQRPAGKKKINPCKKKISPCKKKINPCKKKMVLVLYSRQSIAFLSDEGGRFMIARRAFAPASMRDGRTFAPGSSSEET